MSVDCGVLYSKPRPLFPGPLTREVLILPGAGVVLPLLVLRDAELLLGRVSLERFPAHGQRQKLSPDKISAARELTFHIRG